MHRGYSNYGGYVLLLLEAGSYKPAHSHQLPLPPNASLRTLRLTGGPSHHLICWAYVGLCSLLSSVPFRLSLFLPPTTWLEIHVPHFKTDLLTFLCLYMYMLVCACVYGVPGRLEEVWDPVELELQAVWAPDLSAGKWHRRDIVLSD